VPGGGGGFVEVVRTAVGEDGTGGGVGDTTGCVDGRVRVTVTYIVLVE